MSIILRAWRSCSLDCSGRIEEEVEKMSLLQKQLQQEMAKKVNQIEIKDASSGKV
jgi:hypothetical protein